MSTVPFRKKITGRGESGLREKLEMILIHRDGRFRVELLSVQLKLFGDAPPILGIEVVVGTALNRPVLVVMRIPRHSHDPHFLLDVISPITLITKK